MSHVQDIGPAARPAGKEHIMGRIRMRTILGVLAISVAVCPAAPRKVALGRGKSPAASRPAPKPVVKDGLSILVSSAKAVCARREPIHLRRSVEKAVVGVDMKVTEIHETLSRRW